MAFIAKVGKYYSSGMKGTTIPPKMPIPEGQKIKKDPLGGLSKETKKLEVAAQTPSQRKSRRTRRFHMLSRKKLT